MKNKFNNISEEQNRAIQKAVQKDKNDFIKMIEVNADFNGQEVTEDNLEVLRRLYNKAVKTVTEAYNEEADKGFTTTIEISGVEFEDDEEWKIGDRFKLRNSGLTDKIWKVAGKSRIIGETLGWLDIEEIEPYNC